MIRDECHGLPLTRLGYMPRMLAARGRELDEETVWQTTR